MYSQNDEERHILEWFEGKPAGRFLDIGAFDGVTFSNVRALYERGWAGTLVEPNPQAFSKLLERYDTSRVHLVNAAIALRAGLQVFHCSPDAVSTLSEDHRALWASQARYVPIRVPGCLVAELLAACPGPYAFLNLDVEGMNWQILQQIPLDALACELACVEYGADRLPVEGWFKRQGWTLRAQNGENQIWSRT